MSLPLTDMGRKSGEDTVDVIVIVIVIIIMHTIIMIMIIVSLSYSSSTSIPILIPFLLHFKVASIMSGMELDEDNKEEEEERSVTCRDIKLIMPTVLILLFTLFVMVGYYCWQ